MKKNALIIGIRNQDSICYYIAKELIKNGYDIYATYQKETENSVKEIAKDIGIKKIYLYDARYTESLDNFTNEIKKDDIMIDALVHGIAYSGSATSPISYLMDVEWEEFANAIRIGAFSLVEIVGRLIDNLREGSSIIALSSRLARLGFPGFNIIGATKASLESIVRGLAESLGKIKNIRVNSIAPAPIPTKSLSKLGNVLEILEAARKKSPLKRNVKKEDIASLAVTIIKNQSVTGTLYTIDTGMDIMG